MFKLGLEKEEEPENKMPTFTGSQRKLDNSKRTSTSVSSTMLIPLIVVNMIHMEMELENISSILGLEKEEEPEI